MPSVVRKTDTTGCGDVQDITGPRTFTIDGLPVAVIGDLTTGHSGAPPTALDQGSSAFKVDGKFVSRVGDSHVVHAYPLSPPHAVIAATGSPTFSTDDGPSTIVVTNTLATGGIPKQEVAAVFGALPETFDRPTVAKQPSAPKPKSPNKQSSAVTQTVAENEKKYAPYIAATEKKYNIPTGLLHRLLKKESSFRTDVITGAKRSKYGATGIAQFMPATANEMGVDPLDPIDSIDGAARLLLNIKKHLSNNNVPTGWEFAVAGYNAGQGNVVNAYKDAVAENNTKNWLAYLPRTEETIPYVRSIVI